MAIDFKVGTHRSCMLHTRQEYRGNPLSSEARDGRQLVTSAAPSELTRDSRQISRLLKFMRDARIGMSVGGATPEQLVRTLQATVERGDVIAVVSKPLASARSRAPIEQEIRPYYETFTPSQLFGRSQPVVRAARSFERPKLPRLPAEDGLAIWFARPGDVLPDGTIATPVATPLGEVQPFEYAENSLQGDDATLAGMPIKEGPPNTWVTNPSGSGQLRLYDANGDAAVDIDFDHDHGFGAPHSHNWDGLKRDFGNPVSILP
ncbi:hypothetical protein [Paraburkholderia antibiotica]|uniref:Uncharacterized protein n=1 Tax=Paraburkholderia antibiotica TaxID=2728839 RepID=A0A7X9ZZL2_9BURK|nr:hypothetical protein [Paraburkholderia antibiotica]NML33415.1 hypothetical protein [Paraburkholderia antibiotica]